MQRRYIVRYGDVGRGIEVRVVRYGRVSRNGGKIDLHCGAVQFATRVAGVVGTLEAIGLPRDTLYKTVVVQIYLAGHDHGLGGRTRHAARREGHGNAGILKGQNRWRYGVGRHDHRHAADVGGYDHAGRIKRLTAYVRRLRRRRRDGDGFQPGFAAARESVHDGHPSIEPPHQHRNCCRGLIAVCLDRHRPRSRRCRTQLRVARLLILLVRRRI